MYLLHPINIYIRLLYSFPTSQLPFFALNSEHIYSDYRLLVSASLKASNTRHLYSASILSLSYFSFQSLKSPSVLPVYAIQSLLLIFSYFFLLINRLCVCVCSAALIAPPPQPQSLCR